MTDDELKTLVTRNAQSIDRLEQQSERTQQQLELLTRQVQAIVSIQDSNTGRIASVESSVKGIFDVLLTNAKEQAERSKLIDQQIQALIDERRCS